MYQENGNDNKDKNQLQFEYNSDMHYNSCDEYDDQEYEDIDLDDYGKDEEDYIEDYPEYIAGSPCNQQQQNYNHMFAHNQQEMISLSNRSPTMKSPTILTNQESPVQAQKVNNLNAQLICGQHQIHQHQANNRGQQQFPQQVNANIIEDVNGSILQNIDLEGDDYSDVNFEDEQEELEENNHQEAQMLQQEDEDVRDSDDDDEPQEQNVLSENTSNQKLLLQFKSFDAQPQTVNKSGLKQISVSQSIQNGSSFKEAPDQMMTNEKITQPLVSSKSPLTQFQKKNSSTNRHFTVSRKHSKMHKTPNQKLLPQMNNLDMLAASYNNKMETRRLNHKAKLQMQQQHQKSSNKKKKGHGLTGIQSQVVIPKEKSIWVDTLVIGSGPAALGFLVNALKTGRLNDLIRSKDNGFQNNMGLAIIDQGISLGGGQLGNYGINSNTSAGGFLKCISKATKKKNPNNNLQMGPLNQLLKDISKNHHQNLDHIQRNLEKGLIGHRAPQTQKINSKKTYDLKKNNLEAGSFQKLGIVGNAVPFTSQQAEKIPGENIASSTNNDTLSAFRDLAQSKIYKSLKDTYGKSIVPLSMIGHFLNYVGNWILHHCYLLYSNQERSCKIFYPMHKAEHIQLMSNGDVLTRVQKRKFYIQNGDQKIENDQEEQQGEYEMTVLDNGTRLFIQKEAEIVYFRSKSVILANGGQQILHPEFFNWFPNKKSQEHQVITSDYFLKRVGFLQTMKNLAIPQPKKKKVVIVGGSHSGFSCAWLLLNGASSFEISMKQHGYDGQSKPYPLHAYKKYVQNCQSCCKCINTGKSSTMIKQPHTCKICVCKCFGYFQFQDWKAKELLQPLDFEKDIESVSIIHREDIKVFYKRVQDAEADNYKNFKKTDFQNQNGYLYSFTGLRGDAKELYKKVSNGTEKRLKLIQAKTVEEQAPYINDADLVIWACGYQTNFIPIYDMALQFQTQQSQIQKRQEPLMLSQRQPGTQFDVDNKCRLLLQNGIILAKIFACGIGYPVKTNDGKTMGPKIEGISNHEKQILLKIQKQVNPRADSFSLYMNIVADLLIKNILPKDKKISKMVTHKIYPPTLCIQPQHHETQVASPFKIVKEQSKSLKPQIQQILPHRGQIDLKKMIAPQQVQLRLSTGSQFQSDQKLQIAPSNLNATTNLIDKRKANAKNRQGRQSKSQNRGTRLDKLHKFMPINNEKTERPSSKALNAQPIVIPKEDQQQVLESVTPSQPKFIQNLDEYKIVCHSVVHTDQKPPEVDHKKSRENIQQSQAQSLSSIGTRLIPHNQGLSQLNFTQQQQRFISKSPYITDQIKTIDQDKFKKVKKSRKDANKQRRHILKDSRNDVQSDSIHEGQVIPTAHIQLNKRKSQETQISQQQSTTYHQSKSQSQIFSVQSVHNDQAQFQTQVILGKKESDRDYQVSSCASNQYIPMTNLKSAKSQHGHKTKEMFRFNNGYLKSSNLRKQLVVDDSQSESTTMLPPIINQNVNVPDNVAANPQNHPGISSEQTSKREELIKKVVKNQQCRMQQHRILSGNFAQNTGGSGATKINSTTLGQKYAISNLNSRAGHALGSRTQSQVKEYDPIKNKKNIFNTNMNLSLKQPRVQKNHNEYGLTPKQTTKMRKQQSEISLRSQQSRHSRFSSNNDIHEAPRDENMRYNHNQSSPQQQIHTKPKSQINGINSFYQNVSKKSYLNYNQNTKAAVNIDKHLVSLTSRISVVSHVEKNTIEEDSQQCFSGHLIESSVESFQEHEDPHNETSQVPDDLEPKKDTHAQSLQHYQVNKKQGPSNNFFLKQASSFKMKEPSSAFKGSIASDFTLDRMDLQVTYANTALNHQDVLPEQDRKFDQQLLNNAEIHLQAPPMELISTISQKQRKSSPNLLLSAERRSRASRQQQTSTADKLKAPKKSNEVEYVQPIEQLELTSSRNAKNQSEMPSIQNYEKNSLVLNQNKNDLTVQQNPYTVKKTRPQGNNTAAKQKLSERSNTELNSTIKQDQKGKQPHKTPKDSKTERNTGLHHKKKLSQQQSPFKPESGRKYNHLLNKKQLQGEQPNTGKLVNKDYSPILSKSTQKMGKLVSKKAGKNDQIQQVHQNVYKSTKFGNNNSQQACFSAISKASRDSRMSGQKSSDQISQNIKIAPFQLAAQ